MLKQFKNPLNNRDEIGETPQFERTSILGGGKIRALIIDGNDIFPSVVLDPSAGKFEIIGKSVPQATTNFYAHIINWLEDYVQCPNPRTEFKFYLEYFNLASSQRILKIIYLLNDLYNEGHPVQIHWYHNIDDDDLLEVGEDYASMVDVPFDVIPVINKEMTEVA